jgi:two-component system chemotaxis response regulator CheY
VANSSQACGSGARLERDAEKPSVGDCSEPWRIVLDRLADFGALRLPAERASGKSRKRRSGLASRCAFAAFANCADRKSMHPLFGTKAAGVLPPQGGNRTMRILIVDDSATMRRIIRNNLKAMGYEAVVEAENGHAALAKIASDSIEFVIVDWAMPVMDGLELVRAIRSNPRHGKLPVLMITAVDQEAEIVQAIQANINGYIVKPFEPDTLKKKVEQILGGLVKA